MTDWRIVVDDRQFQNSLRRLERDILKEAEDEAEKVGSRFRTHLTNNTPILTGDLRASTKQVNESSRDKVSVKVSVGDVDDFHARWLEFGHRMPNGGYIEGTRFFYPLAARYNRLFKLALRRAMKRAYARFN